MAHVRLECRFTSSGFLLPCSFVLHENTFGIVPENWGVSSLLYLFTSPATTPVDPTDEQNAKHTIDEKAETNSKTDFKLLSGYKAPLVPSKLCL